MVGWVWCSEWEGPDLLGGAWLQWTCPPATELVPVSCRLCPHHHPPDPPADSALHWPWLPSAHMPPRGASAPSLDSAALPGVQAENLISQSAGSGHIHQVDVVFPGVAKYLRPERDVSLLPPRLQCPQFAQILKTFQLEHLCKGQRGCTPGPCRPRVNQTGRGGEAGPG